MRDQEIINMYKLRNESAIAATKKRYGSCVYNAALAVIYDREDALECENDTYLTAWNHIPPDEPEYLNGYLCKISRNHAMHRLRTYARQQRKTEKIQQELENSIAAGTGSFDTGLVNRHVINGVINSFLQELDKDKRMIFIGRYWANETIGNIAARTGHSKGSIKNILWRLRGELRDRLVREEISI